MALLLLKLGLGLLVVHGLFIQDPSSPTVIVDERLLFAPAVLTFGGIGGRSIMLPLYNGPINLSLTLLFLRGIADTCGSGAYLSTLSVPSAFFSPAKIALSLSISALWVVRFLLTTKNVTPTMINTTTMAIPIPRPALAPDVISLLSRLSGVDGAIVDRALVD